MYSNVANDGVSVLIYKELIQINKEKTKTTREVAKKKYVIHENKKTINICQYTKLTSYKKIKEANLNNFLNY